MAGAGRVGSTDFNYNAYGLHGFGMADIDELQRRGHSFNEINDYANSLRDNGQVQIGGKVGEWQDSEGRKWREEEAKRLEEESKASNKVELTADQRRAEARERTNNFIQKQDDKREATKFQYEKNMKEETGTEQREFLNNERKGGDWQTKYDFSQ